MNKKAAGSTGATNRVGEKPVKVFRPLPGKQVPGLRVPQLKSGQPWDVLQCRPEKYTLVVFYRGLHCPKCREQLETLNEMLEKFTKRGVDVFALSCDDFERAEKSTNDWDIDKIPLLYDLDVNQARRWGLFISKAVKESEPQYFCEPGVFLIDHEHRLYASWLQSVPFARPALKDILGAIDFIEKDDYPPLGTVAPKL